MTTKAFDCLQMKDEAQMRRTESLRGLSDEARLRHYEHGYEELALRQETLRSKKAGSGGTPRKVGDASQILEQIARLAMSSDDLPADNSQQHEHYEKRTPR